VFTTTGRFRPLARGLLFYRAVDRHPSSEIVRLSD